MIEARGLSKRFQDKKRGEIRAVENVSFTCQPGKIYGLLGANGAGKTTTLRLLATILEPTDGTAVICGHDVVEEPEKVRASVGFLSTRSEEHTSELQSRGHLVCRLLLEKKKKIK